MKRWLSIFLLFAMFCAGSGAAEWLHEQVGHAHDDQASLAIPNGPKLDSAADGGADKDHCFICIGLHAPTDISALGAIQIQMTLAVERAMTLQAQRLDASVPDRIGCRGPPVM